MEKDLDKFAPHHLRGRKAGVEAEVGGVLIMRGGHNGTDRSAAQRCGRPVHYGGVRRALALIMQGWAHRYRS